MKNTKEFSFEKSRPITKKEVSLAKKAIEKITGKKRLKRVIMKNGQTKHL